MLLIGHRGARGLALENSKESIETAINLGVDGVEIDVHRCKDALIVMHDSTLDATSTGHGRIANYTYQELKKFGLNNLEPIPRLEDILDCVNRRVFVNIEIKSEQTAGPVMKVISQYLNRHSWSYQHFLVSSFIHQALIDCRKKDTAIRLGALTSSIPTNLAKFASDLDAYSIHTATDFTSKPLVDDAHKRGLKVFAYTVNTKDDLSRLKTLGVDGIFTDYPDRLGRPKR